MSLHDASIAYGQCWEDADVMRAALQVQAGDTCLSIASAGDNTLALLVDDPARVIAIDTNAAQLACLELRMAAYRTLAHEELLELIGSSPSRQRLALYARCRGLLGEDTRGFWDARQPLVQAGIGHAGRFERYLETIRHRVLSLVFDPRAFVRLASGLPHAERARLFDSDIDGWRWRLLFRICFSRALLGRARYRGCFRHAPGDIAAQLQQRARHAFTTLDPADNPYLHWICTGRHGGSLPLALRPEHFATIRDRVNRIELRNASLGTTLKQLAPGTLDGANLSDVFEYMPIDDFQQHLALLAQRTRRGGRLVYWNLLAPRTHASSTGARLRSLPGLAAMLHQQDKAFFYRAVVIEEKP